MILMLSGEGKTDMGQMTPSEQGTVYEPGPMAWIVDRLTEPRLETGFFGEHDVKIKQIVIGQAGPNRMDLCRR